MSCWCLKTGDGNLTESIWLLTCPRSGVLERDSCIQESFCINVGRKTENKHANNKQCHKPSLRIMNTAYLAYNNLQHSCRWDNECPKLDGDIWKLYNNFEPNMQSVTEDNKTSTQQMVCGSLGRNPYCIAQK